MDKTSIVPNQFFDLFARVIPGGVLIIALALVYPIRIIDWTFEVFVPEGYPQTQSGTLRTQTVPWLVLVLAVAYTLGHLLSPVVKLLMWIAARIDARWPGIKREQTLDALCKNETHTYNELASIIRIGLSMPRVSAQSTRCMEESLRR